MQTSELSPAQGDLYSELSHTTGEHSTNQCHISLLDDRVEYAELCGSAAEPVEISTGVNESKRTLSAGGSEKVATSKPAIDDKKILFSVEQAPIYADLKHSAGTEQSSAALRAIQKFTIDDKVLYSEVKHSAANSTGPSSAEGANASTLVNLYMSHQPINQSTFYHF